MIAALACLALSTPIEPAATLELPASTLELPAFEPVAAPAPMLLGGNTPFSWTYVEANYKWRDVDGLNDSLDGWELRASFELFMNLFLQGAYSQISGDVDLDEYSLGAGWHFPVGTTFDVFGILSYTRDEVDGSGISADEDGPMAEVGGRVMLGEKIEANGEIIWANLDSSETGFDVGGRFYITPKISVGANVTWFDQDELFAVGGRFQF